jgi:hypothetical protein
MDPIINTNGDPKFLIKIDANQDGVYEFSRTSQTFNEASTLTNPYMVTMDVPDNLQHLRFAIEVYDVDTLGDDVIDYTPSASSTSYYCDTNAPFSESWSYNGADDSLSENDCQLSYAISVVAAT